jgi:phage shock protein A
MADDHRLTSVEEQLDGLEKQARALERRIQKTEYDLEQLRSRLNRAEVGLDRKADEFHDHSDYAKSSDVATAYHTH